MRIRPPNTAGRAVCIGMVHMIFSGSSKVTHTAHNDFSHVNLYPVYVPCCVCFRLFKHHISMCLCIFVALAHLSQMLIIKIVYSGPLSSFRPRPSTFSNGPFFEFTGPIQDKIQI